MVDMTCVMCFLLFFLSDNMLVFFLLAFFVFLLNCFGNLIRTIINWEKNETNTKKLHRKSSHFSMFLLLLDPVNWEYQWSSKKITRHKHRSMNIRKVRLPTMNKMNIIVRCPLIHAKRYCVGMFTVRSFLSASLSLSLSFVYSSWKHTPVTFYFSILWQCSMHAC
jgi:hypothetical protein